MALQIPVHFPIQYSFCLVFPKRLSGSGICIYNVGLRGANEIFPTMCMYQSTVHVHVCIIWVVYIIAHY